MKTKTFFLAFFLMTSINYLFSQTTYNMKGPDNPNQILKVNHLDNGLGQTPQLIMSPSGMYEDNGNIGIGISLPTEKLHVAGSILANDNIFGTNINGNIKTQSIQPVMYPSNIDISATTDDNRFIFQSDGNFSLGHILNNYSNQFSMFEIVSDAVDTYTSAITNYDSFLGKGLFIQTNGNIPEQDIPLSIYHQGLEKFSVSGAGDVNFMGQLIQNGTEIKPSKWIEQGSDIYFNDGNVGIGIDSPVESLHVVGSMLIDDSNGGGNLTVNSNLSSSNLTVSNNAIIPHLIAANIEPISNQIYLSSNGFETSTLKIENTGNQNSNCLLLRSNGSQPQDDKPLIIKNGNNDEVLSVNGEGDIELAGNIIKDGQSFIQSQWNDNENGINYNEGGVCIGNYIYTPSSGLAIMESSDNPLLNLRGFEGETLKFEMNLINEEYNGITQSEDFGIFFYDQGYDSEGKNNNSGFVIAPVSSTAGGIRIDEDGNVQTVNLWAQEIIVDQNAPSWPDFVFDDNYNLISLSEIETYININGHLPEIPSAEQVEENGINVAEMNGLLLKKVEELTLYIINLEKRIDEIQNN